MKRVIKFLNGINKTVGDNLGLIIPIFAGLLVYEVIRRYVFNNPSIWVHDIVQFLYGAAYMLAGGYTLLKKGHVNMDIFYGRLSGSRRAWLDFFNDFFILAFLAVLVWKSGYMAWDSFRFLEVLAESGVWQPPLWPIKIVFFIGCMLFLLQAISKFLNDTMTIVNNKKMSESSTNIEEA